MSPGRTKFQTAASTPPVPEALRIRGLSAVWKRCFDFSVTSFRRFVNVSPLWLIIGLIIASITLSGTFVGPGSIISFLFGNSML